MIKKTKVIEGVYFIEIAEVGLYIQCGSPAESVKHLIKKGLITKTSKEGVEFETGPNAILLSDVMIQNGEFSNMSEFSVLQMLYKQGLIIPNHPNNTGLKPLLIGDINQVKSQIQYIYRGNYGLVSQSEIESCGVEKSLAQELFNMKMRFAFGKLQKPTSLLESCLVENSQIEIRDGVFIKRVSVNIFEISYKNECISVDLNLTKNQQYISPYTLPLSRVKKEYFSIIQSGQGDGWDTQRPSMNSIICFQGKYYLIDVVPNINYILDSVSISINEIEGVFLTHCHDDHIAGITTLLRSDKKIKIFGAKIVTLSLMKKLSVLLTLNESEFQNLLDIQDLEIGTWNNIDDLEVRAILSPHSVETTIFIFRTYFEDRFYTYGHFADIADSKILHSMIVENQNEFGIKQSFYDAIIQEYQQTLNLKKVDIGEGMIHGNYRDFIDDKSDKIILAHTDKELSNSQLRVGTSSLFGLEDVLIPSKRNYDYKTISKYLQSNFPSLPLSNFESFLNFEIIYFNPKELLYKLNEKVDTLYLIIDGLVEKNSLKYEHTILLEPGVILGEKAALNDQVIDSAFMTKNYVKALKIPLSYFHYFINKHDLHTHFNDKFDLGWNFLKNNLFNENISYPTMNTLIENMQVDIFDATDYSFDEALVYLVIKGSVDILVNENVLDTVTVGGYFGGLETILNVSSVFQYVPNQPCKLFSIPAFLIRDIPISFWKIIEDYSILQKKLINFNIYNDDDSTFLWNNSYNIHISDMDYEHKEQFEFLRKLNTCIINNENDEKVQKILEQLYTFLEKHFMSEEQLMEKYNFDRLEEHKKMHQELLNKILIFKEGYSLGTIDKSFAAVILKEWLLQHILEEDIQYSRFLNGKGLL